MKRQPENRIFYGLGLVLTLLSLGFWSGLYENHLYFREQTQLFQFTFDYLLKHLQTNGGMAIYAGEFFTQFFLNRFAGAAIITLFLGLVVGLTRKLLCHFSENRAWDMLAFIPGVSFFFWLCNPFYYFSGVIALLIALTASLIFLKIMEHSRPVSLLVIILPLCWWLAGGAYLILTGIAAVVWLRSKPLPKLQNTFSTRQKIGGVVFLLLFSVSFPLAFRHFLPINTLLQTFVSEAFYQIRVLFPLALVILFSGIPVFLYLVSLLPSGGRREKIFQIQLGLLGGLFLLGFYSYTKTVNWQAEREMEFDYLVSKAKWEEIIHLADYRQNLGPVARQALNIALAKTGRLSEKMFHFSLGEESMFPVYERKGMTPMIASETFYQLGLVNFAQMMAMESVESTPDGRLPVRAVKRVAETYLINGQYEVAYKFLVLLKHTLFYRKWAVKALTALPSEEKMNSHPDWGEKRKLMPREDFYYNHQQMQVALLYLLRSNAKNQMAYEYLMAIYLYRRDLDGFLKFLPMAKNFANQELPLVYQEALAYINTLLPDAAKPAPSNEVSTAVESALEEYARAYLNGGKNEAGRMKKDFGKTYWYYLHFGDNE